MAKDPAFLFYYQDFIFGTSFMTNEQAGAYIRTLCHLADKGFITDTQIAMICNQDTDMAMVIIEKLEIQKEGIYYSKRLNTEVEKRRAFADSRRKNLEGKKKKKPHKGEQVDSHMKPHMEDEDEDEDVNIIINRIELREEIFKSEVFKFKQYSASMLQEFFEYWTEPNKSKTKMKFEQQPTWDLKRRLSRWTNNDFGKKEPTATKLQSSKNTNDVDRILSEDYSQYPAGRPKTIKV